MDGRRILIMASCYQYSVVYKATDYGVGILSVCERVYIGQVGLEDVRKESVKWKPCLTLYYQQIRP